MRRLPVLLALALAAACGDGAPALDAAPDDAAVPDPAPDFTSPPAAIVVFEATYRGFTTAGARAALADPAPEVETEVARESSCRLLVFEPGTCEPPCAGVCVGTTCVSPVLRSAGVISLGGLAVEVTLTPTDGAYSQDQTDLPADLFADDATITASAPGEARAGFTLETTGVAAIEPVLEVDQLTLLEQTDTQVTWSPVDPAARVRLQLRSPADDVDQPSYARIECDGPDTGSLTVPVTLADLFPKQARMPTCPAPYCPPSTLTRYRRATTGTADGPVALTAAAEAAFVVEH